MSQEAVLMMLMQQTAARYGMTTDELAMQVLRERETLEAG
jgi:hypothetical protein